MDTFITGPLFSNLNQHSEDKSFVDFEDAKEYYKELKNRYNYQYAYKLVSFETLGDFYSPLFRVYTRINPIYEMAMPWQTKRSRKQRSHLRFVII